MKHYKDHINKFYYKFRFCFINNSKKDFTFDKNSVKEGLADVRVGKKGDDAAAEDQKVEKTQECLFPASLWMDDSKLFEIYTNLFGFFSEIILIFFFICKIVIIVYFCFFISLI